MDPTGILRQTPIFRDLSVQDIADCCPMCAGTLRSRPVALVPGRPRRRPGDRGGGPAQGAPRQRRRPGGDHGGLPREHDRRVGLFHEGTGGSA
ncbi:hypothetical protein HBB16_00235 [Pseudonocardia sp. MCCB 268]|nr:hypothetical protein [Pseudonocardia cytotoxica]